MRTTLIIKEELLEEARKLTKIKEKTTLVHLGLEALIEKFARQRLIALGGVDKKAKTPSRRRRE